MAHSVLIICILHRIWAIRFFVANMLPGIFEKSGGEFSPLLVFFIYIILEIQIFSSLVFLHLLSYTKDTSRGKLVCYEVHAFQSLLFLCRARCDHGAERGGYGGL